MGNVNATRAQHVVRREEGTSKRRKQFKPEWTVMRLDREGEERTMSRAAPQTVGGKIRGVPKNQRMMTASSCKMGKRGASACRERPSWKKGKPDVGVPLQEEVGCLSGAARRGGLRLRACARTGCECRRESQHVARRMSRHRENLR